MPDNQSLSPMPGSPGWIRPNDVMKSRKLKAKRCALEARMSSQTRQILMPSLKFSNASRNNFNKRRNPFKCLPNKSLKLDHEDDSSENSSDDCLFRLMNPKNISSDATNREPKFINFSEALKATVNNFSARSTQEKVTKTWSETLIVDWSLKAKLRFFSPRPLPWKQTFKSIEEASGTTGFVRCLNSEFESQRLDTSTNTKFYECCLVWQHPNLPTVNVFPRDRQKLAGHTGLYGTDPKIASALLAEWSDSMRSLYQLLRVRMCPYFYICAHSFTCIFRAAGVGGVSHTHALITPTTRGFRDAMKSEGVEFSMPLYNEEHLNVTIDKKFKSDCEQSDEEEDHKSEDNKNQESSSFLETLGLDSSQFPSLCQNRIKQESKKYKGIDGSAKSMVYVEDMELQGLINFLLNCNSCVVTTGPLAGVPPTLLAPTAFHGGSLKSLKISGSQVRNVKGEVQHSLEIRGPILPTTVLHMTHILSSLLEKYSLSLTPIPSTVAFNSLLPSKVGTKANVAFASEGLVDCGLGELTREVICHLTEDDVRKDSLPRSYKDICYENKLYHWTDQ